MAYKSFSLNKDLYSQENFLFESFISISAQFKSMFYTNFIKRQEQEFQRRLIFQNHNLLTPKQGNPHTDPCYINYNLV